MKRIVFLVAGITLTFFLLGASLLWKYSYERTKLQGSATASSIKHRVVVLLPESRDHFSTELNRFLWEGAIDLGVALEFRPIPANAGPQDISDAVELATLSRPDGIFLQGYNQVDLRPLIEEAVDTGIIIMTLLTDIPSSKRHSFIGYNSFSHGREVGRFLISNYGYPLTVGLILNRFNPVEPGPMEQGLLAGLAAGLNLGPGKRQVVVEHTFSGTFSGEDRIRSFLQSDNRPQILVCTTARDTIAAAQSILDQNLVGTVSVVGLDSSPEIGDYLDRGIVLASVLRNPKELASLALDAFVEYRSTGRTSDYFDGGFSLWTGGDMP